MKRSFFAAMLVLATISFAHADDKPLIRVQIMYVDAVLSPESRSSYLPPQNVTIGDARAGLTRKLKNDSVHYNVITGPDITTPNGILYACNGLQMKPMMGIELGGPDVFLGPLMIMTPTIEHDDLVSVELHLSDKEPAGASVNWIGKPEIVEASAPHHFEAHSGSIVYLGCSFSLHNIARFTFAKVTIIPPGFPGPAEMSPYSIILIDSHSSAHQKPITKPDVKAQQDLITPNELGRVRVSVSFGVPIASHQGDNSNGQGSLKPIAGPSVLTDERVWNEAETTLKTPNSKDSFKLVLKAYPHHNLDGTWTAMLDLTITDLDTPAPNNFRRLWDCITFGNSPVALLPLMNLNDGSRISTLVVLTVYPTRPS